jgi:hypothetical protein
VAVISYSLHSSLESQPEEMFAQKAFCWAELPFFSSSKFTVQSHILSTAGDALRDEVFLSLIAFSKVLLATTDNNRYLKSLTMTSSPMPKSSTMVPSVSLQSLVSQPIWRLSR